MSAPPPPPAPLSADGMWWWDGQYWQPTELALRRLRTPAPAPQVSQFPYVSCLVGCVSFAIILVGAGGAVLESNNHSVCEGGLGQFAQGLSQSAAQQCAIDNTIFYGGIALAVIGSLMFFAALLVGSLRYRR